MCTDGKWERFGHVTVNNVDEHEKRCKVHHSFCRTSKDAPLKDDRSNERRCTLRRIETNQRDEFADTKANEEERVDRKEDADEEAAGGTSDFALVKAFGR